MNQIYAMRVFVCVAETQSFRRAAQRLKVSNALVTRAIATLEAHLHARLINRTTRNLSLTEAGVHYLDGCRGLLEELDHLEGTVAGSEREPGGTLRIAATSSLSPQLLTELIDGYRARYPGVHVRLTLAERIPQLTEEGFDVGLFGAKPTTGFGLDTESVELSFERQRLLLCAAPSYVAAHGEPRDPDQLVEHVCLAMCAESHGPATWHFLDADGDSQTFSFEPAYAANSASLLRLAAVAGMGVAVLPETLVDEDVAHGALKSVMTAYDVEQPDASLSLVYPRRRFLPARTRSFVDHAMAQSAGAEPEMPPAGPLSIVAHTLHLARHA